jgi:hypothetical protein
MCFYLRGSSLKLRTGRVTPAAFVKDGTGSGVYAAVYNVHAENWFPPSEQHPRFFLLLQDGLK